MSGLRKTPVGTIGSGNVFADLGLPNPEELLAKSRLASSLADTIDKRGMTYARAGKLMDLSGAEVAEICSGRTQHYSTGRLKDLLYRLRAESP